MSNRKVIIRRPRASGSEHGRRNTLGQRHRGFNKTDGRSGTAPRHPSQKGLSTGILLRLAWQRPGSQNANQLDVLTELVRRRSPPEKTDAAFNAPPAPGCSSSAGCSSETAAESNHRHRNHHPAHIHIRQAAAPARGPCHRSARRHVAWRLACAAPRCIHAPTRPRRSASKGALPATVCVPAWPDAAPSAAPAAWSQS